MMGAVGDTSCLIDIYHGLSYIGFSLLYFSLFSFIPCFLVLLFSFLASHIHPALTSILPTVPHLYLPSVLGGVGLLTRTTHVSKYPQYGRGTS